MVAKMPRLRGVPEATFVCGQFGRRTLLAAFLWLRVDRFR